MTTPFWSRSLGVLVNLVCLVTVFSVSVWELRREGVSDFLRTFSVIAAFVTFAATIALVIAMLVKRFTKFPQILSRFVGWRTVLGSFAILFFVFYSAWKIRREDISDIVYILILIAAGFTILGAISLKGVVSASRGDATMKGLLVCIGCGLGSILLLMIPPAGVLLPVGLMAVVYGLGGYISLRLRISIGPSEQGAPPNGGPVPPVASAGALDGPPSVS